MTIPEPVILSNQPRGKPRSIETKPITPPIGCPLLRGTGVPPVFARPHGPEARATFQPSRSKLRGIRPTGNEMTNPFEPLSDVL